MTDTQGTLERARTLHSQGRVADAVPLYREVLARDPHNLEALQLLGVALARSGDVERAVVLLGEAARLQPQNAAVQANLAAALSGAGRLPEALAAYEQALRSEPRLPAALRGHAATLLQLGQVEAAISAFRKAVRALPQDDHACNGLGVALERSGQAAEARQLFLRATHLNAANAEAHHNLGLLEAAAGRSAEALASFTHALTLQPNNPILHVNQGTQLLSLRRAEEALASFERALALQPGDAATHYNRGLALFALRRFAESLASFDRALESAADSTAAQLWRGKSLLALGRPAEALTAFERARALAPQEFEVHMQCGGALTELLRHEEALDSFDRALALNPASAEAANNRGAVLVRLFRPAEALQAFDQALGRQPDHPEALLNKGNVLRGTGRLAEAETVLERARALRPMDATTRWSQALLKLSQGDFRAGLPLYEARLELPAGSRVRHPALPRWSGAEPLGGRTLLVYADQGLGDTLQFARYLPVLEGLGARVIFEVQPPLAQLLRSLPMKGTLLVRGEPQPPADLAIPLGSVPLALGTEWQTIPGGVPYLHAPPAAVAAWAGRLAALPGFKVGLNWHGNPEAEKYAALQARSFPLASAAPLAQLSGVTLVSLQKGTGAEQRATVGFHERIVQLTDPAYMGAAEMAEETAAILSGLDLVITADTALAHLAGALGVPVWVMLQQFPDWRWQNARPDSPWYPSMRLFRQPGAGDWDGLFVQVAAELAAMVRARA
ncbi:MAG: tetratricopeptide repeat protein [Proteobacteria bacterium]|nr:tetratricopeptide repeat protein [Pseudomonadota bacterium]